MKYDLNVTTSTAANNVVITPRRFEWDFEGIPRVWVEGNPQVTHLLNTLSLVAPAFEDWAIPTTRSVLDQITNKELQQEARGFIGQEAHHSVAHKKFNAEVLENAHGFDLSRIHRYIESIIDYAVSTDEQHQVGMCMAGEHFLTNLGDWYLNDVRKNLVLHKKADRLFAWHMAEEIEHTAVVYDVYDLVYGETMQAKMVKFKTMLSVTQLVTRGLYRVWKDLMDQEAQLSEIPVSNSSLKNFQTVMHYAGRYSGRYLEYFSPAFHPWMHNKNRDKLPGLIQYIQSDSV